MTEVDELLARLRKLEPIGLEREFSRTVQQQGRRRLLRAAPGSGLGAAVVVGTAVTYLGWALHFASALYR